MSILQQQASDVRIQEINLSQVITSASSAVGCQVYVSNQGSPVPQFYSNAQNYLSSVGNPNAQISFDIFCGIDFFTEGNAMWACRAVHADAMYASLLMYTDVTGLTTGLSPITAGIPNPLDPNWALLLPVDTDVPVALFYPINGQGSYANTLAVSVVSNNVPTPTNVTAVATDLGGVLPAATYNYQVSATGSNGETLASTLVPVVIASGTTNAVTISWNAVPLATGYIIYGRTSGAIGEINTIGQGTYTWTDTGAIAPSLQVPVLVAPPALNTFTVNVFDTTISSTMPMEVFDCTLIAGTDDNGVSTELESRINPFSQYIQVVNNTPALITVPIIATVGIASLDGGDSGSAPTSYDVANAYKVFANKSLYSINTLINGGHSDPIVQLAMDSLVQARSDSIAALDVPSAEQSAQQAVNYRNLSLNLNSTYSALFNPDVLEADDINGKQQYVPFSGLAAALCARTDRVANPAFSIAGLNRGLVNVLKSRYTFDDGDATLMFKAQVNYTRTFIGQGTALWEQQTLAANASALSWLSVRRIVNVIKTSLYSFLLYSLQEPNDDFTGRQIVGAVTSYLTVLQNARAISSFTVVSDASNNSAAMFNSGIRAVTVIIIPLIPIHEIDLGIVISKQGVSFTETLNTVNGLSGNQTLSS